MNDINNRTVTVSNSLKEAINEIDSEGKIDDRTCDRLIKDMETLKEIRKESLNDIAENETVDKLIEDFVRASDSSRHIIAEVLESITDGKVPNIKQMREMNDEIELLRNRYDTIVIFARKILTDDEMPEKEASIEEYAKAISNSKALVIKRKIDAVKHTLNSFIAVKSLADSYAAALDPYQQQAINLIKEVQNDATDAEDAIKRAETATLFMDALNCKNYESTEWDDLLYRVSDEIDVKVSLGLASHKYFINETVEKDSINEEPSETDESIDVDDIKEDIPEDYSDTEGAEEAEPESNTANSEKTVVFGGTTCGETIGPERSYFYDKDINSMIEETGFRFTDFTSIELSIDEMPSQARKTFSVKKFKEELRKTPYTKTIILLLSTLRHYRVFNYDLKNNNFGVWTEIIKSDGPRLSDALDFLFRRGYIRTLYAEGYPKVVGLTEKGSEIFKNKTSSEYVTQYYDREDNPCIIVDKPESYLSYVLTLDLFESIADLKSITDTFSDCYQITFGSDQSIAYTSGALRDAKHMKSYLSDLAISLEGHELKEVHVFQYTKEQADAIGKMITYMNTDSVSENTRIISHYIVEDHKDNDEETVIMENDTENVGISAEHIVSEEKEIRETSQANSDDVMTVAPEKFVELSSTKIELQKTDSISNVSLQIEDFINKGDLYCAAAYAGAFAHKTDEGKILYDKLAYAINDPAAHCTYSSDKLFDIYTDFDTVTDFYYQTAAVLRLFFADQSRYDYNLQQIHDSISGSPALSDNKALNDLIYDLRKFRTKTGTAVDRYADYRSRDLVELEKEIEKLRKDAEDYYDTDFVKQRMIRTKTINRRYEATWKSIFAIDNYFANYMRVVISDDAEALDLTKDYLLSNYIKEGMSISADNIDPRKIEDLITSEWDKAIEQVALRMKSSDLTGSIRNNLKQHILKDVNTICNWVELRDALGNTKDSGHDAYAAVRGKLLGFAEEAIDIIENQLKKAEGPSEAGLRILLYAVDEVKRKLDGTYKLTEQKYFYKGFLTTNYVILGDDYLPDHDCTIPSIIEMDMMRLIEKHSQCSGKHTIEDNLNDYCNDNYGSAGLIADYLKKTKDTEPEILKTLPEAEKKAEEQLEIVKSNFESDLILAQSCGQLDADNSEDKMDNILNIADRWYTWAESTHNFGFYKDLLGKIRQQIKTDATERGELIRKELESLLEDNNSLERDNSEYVNRIRKTIDRQNYLVAEDMINHLLAGDIPQGIELFEEDYLKEFQAKYIYYFKLAGTSGQNLANLVKTNNLRGLASKDEKGATILKDNWAKPGATINANNLKNILNALGINIYALSPAKQSGVFNVRVQKTLHEDEKSYGHPIYGFGSVAAREGFRVIWLSGAYNADALISKGNELGKSKHTLVFLDYALTESERRRLARKIKEDGSVKIFGVVDRVLYMYLIHNYSSTYISRMLMETMMPYAYFQPYVYDSATIMPPEMFMGRKNELEKIKDPAGVNIVYGGRQLGKSALLRKAKADIDGEEENNKAILIDIKDLDYVETARKISQTLYDQKIIDRPVDNETDWSSIARIIKNTLNNSKEIRYLLLMMDEADTFLESCESVNYSPFNALKDIQQNVEAGRFKFVVAGLRNVVRFNKAATSGNSVLPHLEPLVIKPFTTLEARALLEQPLYYLGFRFPTETLNEHTDLVPMILATANYFPGLIQMYCAKLIEALKKNYGGYNESMTPPYVIEEGLIKSVLTESGFRSQIKEKLMITLRVGDDEYYYILALILAYLYRNKDSDNGYAASDILSAAKEFETKYIKGMTVDQIEALMIELCELNVMRMTRDNRFLFSRRSFLSMLGTSSEVEDRLILYMEE